MLYTLAQLGFHVDIMKYGINVIMDVINLAVDIHERAKDDRKGVECVDLSDEVMDGEEG